MTCSKGVGRRIPSSNHALIVASLTARLQIFARLGTDRGAARHTSQEREEGSVQLSKEW